ncbi:sn-glycerol-3-phosphate import ATP-binding protein UgpC [Phreatobacter aquaticus]|uniref:sn-glycerol-3-phosphate import ATP-binding protein UgpC n=1 Tax=Phreatobacter aquaticus TaxID=2570229 RepID=A0A4D7QJW8_9HYPH|nr:sn-glycerol-3-phosphate import ATP-binding protein UgpC [Phreatobacter aquaticus]QCK85654.1 sn-glycerol-3-phosphate import ATP-binding protein UgpC [Phreatobacter aquaticus]
MSEVVLDQVRKVYAGNVEAVRGVSIDVPDGAFCVLVGPSGCGKSTLLRMIAGLETITGGTVSIGTKRVNELEPAERDIAMVFQNYALYPHMSVYDNMAYGLRNRGTPKDEIDARVREAARILEIGTFLDRKPRQLSGGQRQRVAMGRAIVRKPQVFLFDEPLSNLDAKLRIQMRVEIKKLQRDLGVTSVYVTHDQLEAMTLADVLVVMNKGLVEQAGKPLDLYEKPATTFVASFIGAPPMNLVAVERQGENGWSVPGITGGAGLPMPAGGAMLGIRPEHLHVATGSVPDGALALSFPVLAVEAVGAETFVHGPLGGTGAVVIARLPGKALLEPGTPVSVFAHHGDLHLFDRETGKRIAT